MSVFEKNVLLLQCLLQVSVWRFHVPSQRKLPHPGDRKLWEGCLEEVQWAQGEVAYRVSAEGQKHGHGV